MDKNEAIVAAAQISARKFAEVMRLIRHLVTSGAVVWSVQVVVTGVVKISERNPDAITALSRVVEAFKLSDIVWAIVSLMAGSAWLLERRGKKRALKELGERRRKDESKDPYRSSSKLNRDGSTPEDKYAE